MKDDYDREIPAPKTVPATIKLLELLGQHFDVLDNFHPSFTSVGSVTLVDVPTKSAITLAIVESDEEESVYQAKNEISDRWYPR